MICEECEVEIKEFTPGSDWWKWVTVPTPTGPLYYCPVCGAVKGIRWGRLYVEGRLVTVWDAPKR